MPSPSASKVCPVNTGSRLIAELSPTWRKMIRRSVDYLVVSAKNIETVFSHEIQRSRHVAYKLVTGSAVDGENDYVQFVIGKTSRSLADTLRLRKVHIGLLINCKQLEISKIKNPLRFSSAIRPSL